jgi:branched-chain amino acid transport system permease protein
MTQYLIGLGLIGTIFSIIALALNVRWGWAGEFDIALFAFVAIGAYVYAVVTLPRNTIPPPSGYILGLSAPFLVGVVAAGVASAALAAVVGGIALRKLRDDYFGITTLAFALVLSLVIGQYTPLFDGYEGLFAIPQPFENAGNLGREGGYFLIICVATLLVALWVLRRIFRSPFGRAVRSVREDDVASRAFGRNVYLLKLKAYVLGGFVAGIAGALLAAYITAFNPYGWFPQETFLIYAALFIGGTGNIYGSVFGAFFVAVGIQEVTRYLPAFGNNASSSDATRLIIIGLLIIGILWLRPQGVFPEPRDRDGEPRPPLRLPRRLAGLSWLPGTAAPASADGTDIETLTEVVVNGGTKHEGTNDGSAASGARGYSARTTPREAPGKTPTQGRVLLDVRDVSKSFGGLRAVDGASLTVQEGSLTGLIGPNGAGKSTMINLISGFEHLDSGVILFDDEPIGKLSAHARARRGLVRSFQTPREWGGLTVMENMLLSTPVAGRETVWRAVLNARGLRRREMADRALSRDLLDEVGLLRLKNELAGNLSGGQKRLLEFARLTATKPRFVLLDEPQAGVNPVLRERMAELIRMMVDSGVTVLMVEHNLAFLESLCERVIVMAVGKPIAEGSMAELRGNAAVVDAYLGQADPADV